MLPARRRYVPAWDWSPSGRSLLADLAAPAEYLLMLKVYLDDSKTSGGNLAIVAGWIAPVTHWDQFEIEWKKALKEFGIKTFHATDFFACQGEFEGWDAASRRHRDARRRFTAIARSFEQVGVARGVIVPVFEGAIATRPWLKEGTPHNRFTPLMWCLRLCLEWITYACPRPPNEPIHVTMEKGKGCGEAIEYCQFLDKREAPWMEPYSEIGTNSKSLLPLQAADLLAYETKHRLLGLLNDPKEKLRASFQRLLVGNQIDMRVMHDAARVKKGLEPLDKAIHER